MRIPNTFICHSKNGPLYLHLVAFMAAETRLQGISANTSFVQGLGTELCCHLSLYDFLPSLTHSFFAVVLKRYCSFCWTSKCELRVKNGKWASSFKINPPAYTWLVCIFMLSAKMCHFILQYHHSTARALYLTQLAHLLNNYPKGHDCAAVPESGNHRTSFWICDSKHALLGWYNFCLAWLDYFSPSFSFTEDDSNSYLNSTRIQPGQNPVLLSRGRRSLGEL